VALVVEIESLAEHGTRDGGDRRAVARDRVGHAFSGWRLAEQRHGRADRERELGLVVASPKDCRGGR